MARAGKTLSDVVRDICLGLPEVEEVMAHGSPDFRVAGKTFATHVINHHGDGHLALWLNAPAGAQEHLTSTEPEYFYVPPYVGPRGWLGVDLDRGLDWTRVAKLIRQAYLEVCPQRLAGKLPELGEVQAPTRPLDPEVIDPLVAPHAVALLARLRPFCLSLPEVREVRQFGNPAWQAGKKTFCTVSRYERRLEIQGWVGAEQQINLTFDDRYRIPPYTGHNGWIALVAEEGVIWEAVEQLVLVSYRHFALKRMLKQLGAERGLS